MLQTEAAVLSLQIWQEETGQVLPRLAAAIARVEGDCLIDLVTGEMELLTEDWGVFAQIWRCETERRLEDVNYCRLAVALRKAGALVGAEEWGAYLAMAKGLLGDKETR